MRIAVFGTGGVGGYFGGRLAQAGEDVVFIARGKHLQAMLDHGLKVDSIQGNFVVNPVQATDDPAKVGVVDLVLFGVKAWQITEAAQSAQPMVGPDTMVLPLQNGVEAPSQLTAVLGREHVLSGLCALITFIAGPGHICHTGFDPLLQFGELDNNSSERVEKLRQVFSRATGFTVKVPPDITTAIWQKFMLITAWSGLGAITRAPIGVICSQPGTRQMLKQALQEIYEVAQAHNISLPAESIDKTMQVFGNLPKDGTTSMQRDIMAGRPSELENQNGAVVRLGREAQVNTTLNSFIYNSLLALEMRARSQIQFSD